MVESSWQGKPLLDSGGQMRNSTGHNAFLECQPRSTGPKYIFLDSFVRHQDKESDIGLGKYWWGKVWVLHLIGVPRPKSELQPHLALQRDIW